MKRIKGLDSIRFVCAVYVLLGHFGIPFIPNLMKNPNVDGLLLNLIKVFSLTFNGPAAVIIFFIISGFCINYPYQQEKKIDLLPYYSRRLLRIGIPAIVAAIICYKFNSLGKFPDYGVFWSIICEVIYYLIFPILFSIRKIIKWQYIVIAAYIICFTTLLLNPGLLIAKSNDYPAMGIFTWVIGLPCWLLGCWLSENYYRFTTPTVTKIWVLRFCMIIGALLLNIIKFHAPTVFASNCYTLNIFAIPGTMWLAYEIMYFEHANPSSLLEKGGKWSYSLYIIHPATIGFFIYYKIGDLNNMQLPILICSLVFAYVFYLIVEKPSHKFSSFISKKLLTRSKLLLQN
nr:acyltransferase [uncultured Pedobacter sp.]